MVSVGFRRPGPSGTGPGALDLKEQGMIRDSLWDPQIWFFSKVVETKVVEEDNNGWFKLVFGGQDHLTTQSRRVIGDPKIIFKMKSFRETKPKLKAWQDRVHYIIFQNLTFKGQKGHKKAMNLTFWPLTKFFIAKFNS